MKKRLFLPFFAILIAVCSQGIFAPALTNVYGYYIGYSNLTLPSFATDTPVSGLSIGQLSLSIERDKTSGHHNAVYGMRLKNNTTKNQSFDLHSVTSSPSSTDVYIDGEKKPLAFHPVSVKHNDIHDFISASAKDELLDFVLKAADSSKPLSAISKPLINYAELSLPTDSDCIEAELSLDTDESFDVLMSVRPTINHKTSGKLKLTFPAGCEQVRLFLFNTNIAVSSDSLLEKKGANGLSFNEFKDCVLSDIFGQSYNQQLSDDYLNNNYYNYLMHLNKSIATDKLAYYNNLTDYFADYYIYTHTVSLSAMQSVFLEYRMLFTEKYSKIYCDVPSENFFEYDDDTLKIKLTNIPLVDDSLYIKNGNTYTRDVLLKETAYSASLNTAYDSNKKDTLSKIIVLVLITSAAVLIIVFLTVKVTKNKKT